MNCWKKYFSQEDYEKLDNFLDDTINGTVLDKFLLVNGPSEKTSDLINNIIKWIGKEKCLEMPSSLPIFDLDIKTKILCYGYEVRDKGGIVKSFVHHEKFFYKNLDGALTRESFPGNIIGASHDTVDSSITRRAIIIYMKKI